LLLRFKRYKIFPMDDFWKKISMAAMKTGRFMGGSPHLKKAADNLKEAANSFVEGYRERANAGKTCPACQCPVTAKANFCPGCGQRLNPDLAE